MQSRDESKNSSHCRDIAKKIQRYEYDFDETNNKLVKGLATLEEKEKAFKKAEEVVSVTYFRCIKLMDEEAKKANINLADTVTKLAKVSKEADGIILKMVKSTMKLRTMWKLVEIEEADKNMRETTKMFIKNKGKR